MNINRPSICFATMCKNEEHCIEETLESVYKYIDYWIVCDTGSTDKTCDIITNFFNKKNIPGELFVDDWVSFECNKTKLFERCYKKTDYIMHMDADDLLCGNFNLTTNDNYENTLAYSVKMKRGTIDYFNLVLFNNKYKWKICGVAHTIAKCLDNFENLKIITLYNKDFYVWSRDIGSRSADAEKYKKDALILEKQFFDTLNEDIDNLNSRSAFYTAQSYMDSGDYINAIKWYSLYLKLEDTWIEEIFESHLKLGVCLKITSREETKILNNFNKAKEIFKDRAEPYYELGKFYYENNKFHEARVHFMIAKNKNYNEVLKKYNLFININAYSIGNDINNYLEKC